MPLTNLKSITHKNIGKQWLAKKLNKKDGSKHLGCKVDKVVVKQLSTELTMLHFLLMAIRVIHAVIAAIMFLCRLNYPLRTLCFACLPQGLFGPIMWFNGRQVAAESHSVALQLHMVLTVSAGLLMYTHTAPL